MAWLGEKRKTEFSWTPAIQAVSESRIFEQNKHFSRYLNFEVMEIRSSEHWFSKHGVYVCFCAIVILKLTVASLLQEDRKAF